MKKADENYVKKGKVKKKGRNREEKQKSKKKNQEDFFYLVPEDRLRRTLVFPWDVFSGQCPNHHQYCFDLTRSELVGDFNFVSIELVPCRYRGQTTGHLSLPSFLRFSILRLVISYFDSSWKIHSLFIYSAHHLTMESHCSDNNKKECIPVAGDHIDFKGLTSATFKLHQTAFITSLVSWNCYR